MIQIIPYIKELLSKNEFVTIPDFGTFEWVYESARINHIDQEILPPSCHLIFNVNKTKDPENRLAKFVAERAGFSIFESENAVNFFKNQIEDLLEEKNEISIVDLGTFIKTDNIIEFQLFDSINEEINPYINLPKLPLSPVQREKPKEIIQNQQNKIIHKKGKSKVSSVFVSISVFLIIFSAVYFFISNAPSKNSTELKPKENIAAEKQKQIPVIDSSDSKTDSTVQIDTAAVSLKKHKIIIGVFSNIDNIELSITKVAEAGFECDSDILKNGTHKIYAVIYTNSTEELKAKLKEIRSKISPKAYIEK